LIPKALINFKMALEHPNLDLLVPFDALPPAKAFKP
jgi:hypothetical protein